MYMHSFVKLAGSSPAGWYAPVELGDDAPHYISFAIPVGSDGRFGDAYTCEVVSIRGDRRSVEPYSLVKVGQDSFVLELPAGFKLWFTTSATVKGARLPYVGKLKHQDFDHDFIEIEPENQTAMDRLCDEHGLFVIGCDPIQHYSGLPSQAIAQADNSFRVSEHNT